MAAFPFLVAYFWVQSVKQNKIYKLVSSSISVEELLERTFVFLLGGGDI